MKSLIVLTLAVGLASTLSLSVPRDYHMLDTITLASGEEQTIGYFVKPSGPRTCIGH